MKKRTIVNLYHVCVVILFISVNGIAPTSMAQVGINNPDPDPSAILDLRSTDKGLLIPRLPTANIEGMLKGDEPAHGLLVFDTDKNMFLYYNASPKSWISLNPWHFKVPEGNFSTPEQFKIYTDPLATGNVGIGLNNPSEKLEVAGNIKNTGNLATNNINAAANITVGGTVTATGTVRGSKVYGEGTLPAGAIIMWTGTTPPVGWTLCDGSNNSPDLRGRFIVGYNPGDADYNAIHKRGGEKEVALTEEEMPAHSHSYVDNQRADGNAGGSIEHRGGTKEVRTGETAKTGGIYFPAVDTRVYNTSGKPCDDPLNPTDGCNPYHGAVISGSYTPARWETKPHENRPPYYTLAFIMKLPY